MNSPAFQAPYPEELAELLPQFDIEYFIAQGGMGAVYKGRQVSLDRDIAIKVLPVEMGEDELFRESFITEARAMAKLNHPNLLGVFDFGDVEGMPYIVMEYVDGESLHDAAYQQEIEAIQAAHIVKGICDGLAHAHKHGIIHRDIKPSNILLTQDIEVKVADFGLAQATDSDKPGLDMGTPGYTAPEVFEDASRTGPLADMYSVGVILHQLLSGTDPAGSMEPPTEATGNIMLDKVWRRATSIDPSKRYPSMAAMGKDIDKWMKASNSVRPAPATRPAAASVASAATRRPPAYVQTSSGGNGGLIMVLTVVLLGLVGLFIYKKMNNEEPQTKKTTASENPKLKPTKPVIVPANPEPEDERGSSGYSDSGYDDSGESVNPFDFLDMDEESDEDSETGSDVVVDTDPDEDVDSEEPTDNLPPGDVELRQLAIGLIEKAREDRNQELAKNVRGLHFQVDTDFRNTGEREREVIAQLKDSIDTGRVPDIGKGNWLPQKIVSAFEKAEIKERSIDANYQAELVTIRDAYVKRLETAAEETSDEDLKKRLLAQAERAEDLSSWVALLSPESEAKRIMMTKNGVYEAGDILGKWISITYDKESRWIAHADGRMEIVGEDWEVTWAIINGDTLIVDWKDKPPYRYTREGDRWVGTNSYDKEAILERGDW